MITAQRFTILWFFSTMLPLIADETLRLVGDESGHQHLQIIGDKDDDWKIFISQDLKTWVQDPSVGTVLQSGKEDAAPLLRLDTSIESQRYYRVEKTDGLYDDTVLREVRLRFSENNWQSILTSNKASGSNLIGTLDLGNGVHVDGVGVRYRGNTSYSISATKKSINIEVDASDPEAEIMGYDTLNLNNAAGDRSLMREPIYFTIMHRYTPSPRGSSAMLFVNDEYWGVYSFAQQEDGSMIRDFFPSNDGDRWRAPNVGGGVGGDGGGFQGPGGGGPGRNPGGGFGGNPIGGPGGGGGFSSGDSALMYLGDSAEDYTSSYELKRTQDEGLAWQRLIHAIDVLNNTPKEDLAEAVAAVLNIDSWLWFLAVENIFADDDSYFNKGADYGLYYEPESGLIYPFEHDGNESFAVGDVNLSPVEGEGNANRPVLSQLLAIPEYRQRYLAHMRTVIDERFNESYMNVLIDEHDALIRSAVESDTKKDFSIAAYESALLELKTFIRNRSSYLKGHEELEPVAPSILSVREPDVAMAGEELLIGAEVDGSASEGIDSLWLHYRSGETGRYRSVAMDLDSNGVYGGVVEPTLAGIRVCYYIEARAGNGAKAARFFPRRAERKPNTFRVKASYAPESSPVRIHSFLAINVQSVPDPQGDFDDWIKLVNITSDEMDLTGYFLSDDEENARKWIFPEGTVIPANGELIVWADEQENAEEGLHANFKLSGSGEEILLVGPDTDWNPLLDSVSFGQQLPDVPTLVLEQEIQ